MSTDRQHSIFLCPPMIKAVPKAPLSQGFLPDARARHEGLLEKVLVDWSSQEADLPLR